MLITYSSDKVFGQTKANTESFTKIGLSSFSQAIHYDAANYDPIMNKNVTCLRSQATPLHAQLLPIIPYFMFLPQQQRENTHPTPPQGHGVIVGFLTKGTINSLIFAPHTKWIATGNWSMNVNNGSLTSFETNMTWFNQNGTASHTHEFRNFKNAAGNVITIQQPSNNVILKGVMDVGTNHRIVWKNVPTTIHINGDKTITISVDTKATNNHFAGQPILGVVKSFMTCPQPVNATSPQSLSSKSTQHQVPAGFLTKGTINSLIFAPHTKWIATGNWSMNVNNGSLTSFETNMTWFNQNGTASHTHEFRNFKNAAGNVITIQQPSNNVILKGVMDVGTNHRIVWKNVPTTIHINGDKTITISVDTKAH